ncbi:MAG: hypothetical protein HZB43_03485 [candidate division Zixibacteria bacterium]|nr:hypothetical protein [candidate division Zixibacteria bacterium]
MNCPLRSARHTTGLEATDQGRIATLDGSVMLPNEGKRMNRETSSLLAWGLRLFVSLAGFLVLTIPAFAGLTHAQEEAIWRDFSNWDKGVNVGSKVLQELAGDEGTEAMLEDYGNAVLVISVSKELFHSGDLEAAVLLIKDKLQDKAIEKITPGFSAWLGWMTWAKSGMELFKDVVFDPMVEQSQIDTYIGLRDAGNSPEDSYAGVRGLGYSIERAKAEFKKQYGDNVFQEGTNDLLPKWEGRFLQFVKAGFESKYLEKLHRETLAAFKKAAKEASARVPAYRERMQALLRRYAVKSVVLEPSTAKVKPGESVVFSAIAVYADKSSDRSAEDVTADAKWTGADGNVFKAGKKTGTFVVTASYAGVAGSATVIVEDEGSDRKSVEELLEDFGKEGDGETRPRLTTGKELLVGIQREFDKAHAEFERCRHDADGRLRSLASEPADVICADVSLAAAYACLESQFDRCAELHREAHGTLTQASPGTRWQDMDMNSDVIPEATCGINPMDQITIILLNTKYQAAKNDRAETRTQLQSVAPGCDPEDLADAGSRPSNSNERGRSDPGGEGNSGGQSGGAVGDGVRFEKMGAPALPNGSSATDRCQGGGVSISVTTPDFPDVIRPDQTYTLDVKVTWTVTGSNVEDIAFRGMLWFMGAGAMESEELTSRNGSRTLHYTVDSRALDFGERANTITVIFGGRITCEGDSSADVGVSVVQAYARQGN